MNPVKPAWNPWPWSIIAFFCLFVPAVVGYAIFASRQNMDLVQNDYYEEELRFQKQIDASQRANASSQPATVSYAGKQSQLLISVPVPQGQVRAQGHVKLYRPSDASLDRTLDLALSAQGTQQIDVGGLRPGLWRVKLTWTAGDQEYFHADSFVVPPKG